MTSRVQIALNVDDLDAAVEFYSRLFGSPPTKRQPGYANFALDDPPLKLSLLTGFGSAGLVNHLGVEVASRDEVVVAQRRLLDEGLPVVVDREITCCYSEQYKVWVDDPGGARWEIYTKLNDLDEAEALGYRSSPPVGGAARSAARSRPPTTIRLRKLLGRTRRRVAAARR
jgi:catechol 2,3-dioxygenase-like lactoylglutathione lyase family enzyme